MLVKHFKDTAIKFDINGGERGGGVVMMKTDNNIYFHRRDVDFYFLFIFC